MRRATVASIGGRSRGNSASRSQRGNHSVAMEDDEESKSGVSYRTNNNNNNNEVPPMEPSLTCMTVVEDGPRIAFACYTEGRNEIVLDTSHANGYDTETVLERFLATTRPNLILVSNKIVSNAPLLQLLTKPPPGGEEEQVAPSQDNASTPNNNTDEGRGSTSQSIPYRLLKSGAFDLRSCQALILQKLRVLSLLRRDAQEHAAGMDDPYRHDRQFFPRQPGNHAVFRPSSYHSLASIVDFDSKVQIQALGALLSFLQTTIFRMEEGGTISVNNIVHAQSSMYMYLNATTFSALHIFATEHHPLVASKGQGNSKEGWSLFSLLDRTKSRGGRQLLREWMLKPLLDLQAIGARQDAIELLMRPDLQTAVGSLLNLLAKIGPVESLLIRMQKCSTQPMDFLVLTRTLSAAVAISNTLGSDVLQKLDHQGQHEEDPSYGFLERIWERCHLGALQDLFERITSIVDEEATNEVKHSVVIRRGFHEQLDAWKDQYEKLEDIMEDAGAEIFKRHPYLHNLSVVFVPQVGFLIALSKEAVFGGDGQHAILELPPDFSHIFNQDDEAFFKNTDMSMLDEHVGDLDGLIKDTEGMIVTELEEDILDTENELRETFKALSELDCILSFAGCAADLNFVRPQVVDQTQNRISIKDGRHPLQEIITEGGFVPNDTEIDDKDRVNVITGPNFSGKSCYTRQVGVLVYMAHIGCFIPCSRATISLTDQIFARISTVETCAVPQSSFQLDLTQMATILRRTSSRSLVLIDEFGKGTSPASGISILTSALKKLSELKCKVICTTHFLEIFSLGLVHDGTDGIKARQMAVHLPDSSKDDASPLFKLQEGVASSSAGLVCAEKAGVDPRIVARAKEINRAMREGHHVKALAEALPPAPVLTPAEKDMLRYFFEVESWETGSDEELRTLIQKVARCM